MIKNHQKWMNLALLEALRCKGLTGKNPNVGCVIVKNEKVIGIGRTGSEGRPHAEENSIKSISNKSLLKRSTMYVTLEPCFHKNSKGFSCADLVVQSGIKEIFIGYLDPDPRTSGKSVSFFRKSGIHIDVGLCGEKAKDINAGFNSRITRSLPYITLKVAISLDGKIALKNKTSKWISNDLSRNFSHLLRSQCDGIMTSSNNVLNDNPELTCRLPGLEKKSPFKIVVDRKLKIKKNSKVLKSFYGEKTIIYYSSNLVKKNNNALLNKNNIIYRDIKSLKKARNTWLSIFNDISSFGINNLMIESGPTFINDLIKLGLIRDINLFRSNKILGNDGLPFIGDLNLTNMKKAFYYKLIESRKFDDDVYELRRLV